MKRNSTRQPLRRFRFFVILARPENQENIGLVARCMKNTGFKNLRITGLNSVEEKAFIPAVHSRDVIRKAQLYANVSDATDDLNLVFAATAKQRKNYPSLSFQSAIDRILHYSPAVRIGLLFGNERTGLTSEELKHSNFRFTIPQNQNQPSYNLSAAVLLTLFTLFTKEIPESFLTEESPLSRREQNECISIILDKLERKGFIHTTNKQHMTEAIYNLLGKCAMTDKDRRLFLALFSKGLSEIM